MPSATQGGRSNAERTALGRRAAGARFLRYPYLAERAACGQQRRPSHFRGRPRGGEPIKTIAGGGRPPLLSPRQRGRLSSRGGMGGALFRCVPSTGKGRVLRCCVTASGDFWFRASPPDPLPPLLFPPGRSAASVQTPGQVHINTVSNSPPLKFGVWPLPLRVSCPRPCGEALRRGASMRGAAWHNVGGPIRTMNGEPLYGPRRTRATWWPSISAYSLLSAGSGVTGGGCQ